MIALRSVAGALAMKVSIMRLLEDMRDGEKNRQKDIHMLDRATGGFVGSSCGRHVVGK